MSYDLYLLPLVIFRCRRFFAHFFFYLNFLCQCYLHLMFISHFNTFFCYLYLQIVDTASVILNSFFGRSDCFRCWFVVDEFWIRFRFDGRVRTYKNGIKYQSLTTKTKTEKMFLDGTNGIRPIGDGLLDVTDASLKNLIVQGNINEIYDVEQDPFARYVFGFNFKFLVSFVSVFARNVNQKKKKKKSLKYFSLFLSLLFYHTTNVKHCCAFRMCNCAV